MENGGGEIRLQNLGSAPMKPCRQELFALFHPGWMGRDSTGQVGQAKGAKGTGRKSDAETRDAGREET